MIRVDALFFFESKNPHARYVGNRNDHQWCHLFCDDGEVDQLHVFASRIGMKRAWFQDKRDFPHYDLTPGRRLLALKLGAVETNLRDWMQQRRAERGPLRPSSLARRDLIRRATLHRTKPTPGQ